MNNNQINLFKLVIPMIRRMFGVQPMSGPVGLSFALDYSYGTKSGVLLIPYTEKDNDYDNSQIANKSVVGIEYKPGKVKVLRVDGKRLKRSVYTLKESFNKKYFIEAL